MSWYYRTNAITYTKRAPIRVYDSGVGTSGDVQVTIPEDWDDFWSEIDSSGDEIRVTLQDGTTLATYQWSSFTKSSRTGVLEVDAPDLQHDFSTVDQQLLWLYYAPDATDTDGSGSFTLSADYTARIDVGAPDGPYVYRVSTEPFGASQPSARIHKYTDETIWIWVDMTPSLLRRRVPFAGRRDLEEVASVTYDVQTGGASQSSMIEADWTRIVYDREGRTWAGVAVTGGSSGTDYTLEVVWRAQSGVSSGDPYSEHRWSALIDVQDLDET